MLSARKHAYNGTEVVDGCQGKAVDPVMFLSDRLNKINVIGLHVSPVFSIADDIVFYESV